MRPLGIAFLLAPLCLAAGNPQDAKQRPQDAQSRRTDRHGDPLPRGAIARLGSTRLREGNGVQAVAFLPSGKTVASGGYDGIVRLWDAATGREVRRFGGGEARVVDSIALSPDGETLISGEVAAVHFWEVSTGKEVRKTSIPGRSAQAVVISPDGSFIAAGGEDKIIRLLDAKTGKVVKQFKGEGGVVRALAFSPNGEVLASAGGVGRTIVLWDVHTGSERLRLEEVARFASDLAFLPDGKRLIAYGEWHTVIIFDTTTGDRLLEFVGGEPKNIGFRALALSPDGKMIATGSPDGTIRLWEPMSGKEIRRFGDHKGWITSLGFSPNGERLVSGGRDGTIRLWDVATGRELVPHKGHGHRVSSIAFLRDGEWLVSAGLDATLRVWDVGTARQLRVMRGHKGGITSIALSPDGSWVASGSGSTRYGGGDRTVRLWDVATGEQRLKMQRPIASAVNEFALDGDIPSVAVSPDGTAVAAVISDPGSKGIIQRWDALSGRRTGWMPLEDTSPSCLVFSPNGSLIASGGRRKPVVIWRPDFGNSPHRSGKKLVEIDYRVSSDRGLAFSPDGRMLAVGARAVTLHEVATGRELSRINADRASVVTFSPDGRLLACGRREIRVWNLLSGKEIARYEPGKGSITCLAFSPNGGKVASAMSDGTVLVWKAPGFSSRPDARMEQSALDAAWAHLGHDDAAEAYEAMRTFWAAGGQAIVHLKKRLTTEEDPSRRIDRLISDLDNEDAQVREKASEELKELGERAEKSLVRAMLKTRSPEVRARVSVLLELLRRDSVGLSGERLRQIRAIQVLEHIGTQEARSLLEQLSTRDALEALKRLDGRERK